MFLIPRPPPRRACFKGNGDRATIKILATAHDKMLPSVRDRINRGSNEGLDEGPHLIKLDRHGDDSFVLVAQVLRCVETRELRLAELRNALQSFQWHRGRDTDAVGLITTLAGLRDASLAVVRAIVASITARETLQSRQAMRSPHCFRRGSNPDRAVPRPCRARASHILTGRWLTRLARAGHARALCPEQGSAQ